MAPITATVSIRYAVMAIIMVTAYFTVQAQAQNARTRLIRDKVEEITQYINRNIHKGLETVQNQNETLKKRISLPRTNGAYKVSLNCWEDRLMVNVTGRMPSESTSMATDIKCDKLNVSGEIIPGDRCMIIEKKEKNVTNIEVMNYCTI